MEELDQSVPAVVPPLEGEALWLACFRDACACDEQEPQLEGAVDDVLPTTATIAYVAVGPAGSGALATVREVIDAVACDEAGSSPLPAAGFRFAGWFYDAECTLPVKAGVNGVTGRLTLTRPAPRDGATVGRWEDATYYGLFAPASSCLHVEKRLAGPSAKDTTWVYSVIDEWGDAAQTLTVVVPAGQAYSSALARGLEPGAYTVVENGTWAWRAASVRAYTSSPAVRDASAVVFGEEY